MISLRQLHYFVEIVESGGFSRAAERLFVAQSARANWRTASAPHCSAAVRARSS